MLNVSKSTEAMLKRCQPLFPVLLFIVVILSGCSSHAPATRGKMADSIAVVAQLTEQLSQWQGTPYRYGGLGPDGVDCSGFVFLTFRDRFGIILPRSAKKQSLIGTPIARHQLRPGDLLFFKTDLGSGLHVGIYKGDHKFIHVSTRQGVVRSSLDNQYWRRVYWQARRISV